MTYQAKITEDGKLDLPAALIAEMGLRPGDIVSVNSQEKAMVLAHYGSLTRLREALRDYSVDQFLAERQDDDRG